MAVVVVAAAERTVAIAMLMDGLGCRTEAVSRLLLHLLRQRLLLWHQGACHSATLRAARMLARAGSCVPSHRCAGLDTLLEKQFAPGVVLFHVALEGLLAGQLVAVQGELRQSSELAQLGRNTA